MRERAAITTPKQLARELARRAREIEALALVRLRRARGPLPRLQRSFARTHAPLSVEQFADSYAQTVSYGLLAARWLSAAERPVPFDRAHLSTHLPSTSPFLRELFEQFVNSRFDRALAAALDELMQLLAATPLAEIFAGERDPAIHFYQDFLAAYDPRSRRQQGVYYTPDELVAYLVEAAHRELIDGFGLPRGLADTTTWAELALARPKQIDARAAFVQIMDPATGTGTFLLHVIELVHRTMAAEYARAGLDEAGATRAWRAYVRKSLLPRLHGCERMPAPWVVAHLRLGLALQRTGFVFGARDRLRVELCDTLQLREHNPAISVVLGNPPYERESADADGQHAGGWIRGDGSERAPLEDYLEPVRRAGRGGDLKPAYNLYVYFWRWAQWRVFESPPGLGVIAMVTGSSFLRGPGFAGMRASLRQAASRIDVLDLEGDQKGARKSENVFDIMSPVAATLVVRRPNAAGSSARYHRVEGSRADKLAVCAALAGGAAIPWQACPSESDAPLIAAAHSAYRRWPKLADVFPWQHTGAEFQRNWAIAETAEQLQRRWRALLRSDDRARDFRESRDRKLGKSYEPLFLGEGVEPPIASLGPRQPTPRIERYLFRAFDRRYCLADARIGTVLKPVLWNTQPQIFMISMLTKVLGEGPAAIASVQVPDRDAFCGRGGKDVIALWRDPHAREANVCAALLRALERAYGRAVEGPALFAYAYAVLANPGYVRRFADELQLPGPRLPLSKHERLFERGVALGQALLDRQTYARVEPGAAAVLRAIPETPGRYPTSHDYEPTQQRLRVGEGEIGPVAAEVWGFSISGLQVVKSWLDHRMRAGAGRRSSVLDDIRPQRWTPALTRELLELLWVIEHTLARVPELDAWLDEVLAGELFDVDELPQPRETERAPPKPTRAPPKLAELEITTQQLARALAERARHVQSLLLAQGRAFADAYAQTLAHGLLTARWLGVEPDAVFQQLPRHDPGPELARAREDIAGWLADLPVAELFAGRRDPSIHFYQEFLDAYDPQQRRELGVWSTPDEIVDFMLRAVDQLLRERAGLRLGLADPGVRLLDPAAGTGTFLLRTLGVVFERMREEYRDLGYGDAKAAAQWQRYVRTNLLPRLRGIELMPAPCVVARLRLQHALARGLAEQHGLDVGRWGVALRSIDDLHVSVGDTLASQLDGVTVVLGNPPYDRVAREAVAPTELLDDLLEIAQQHTVFSHHASLYNHYVLFWRWALRQVFEREDQPFGIVALVTPSSWLSGPGFVGLRQLVRERGDEIWSLDLGGDNKGARKEPNVFGIETPVAITIVARFGPGDAAVPGPARYQKIEGETAASKLASVQRASTASPLSQTWARAPDAWHDVLIPTTGDASWQDMPRLEDVFPWQQPGCKFGRLWPISTTKAVLTERWNRLTEAAPSERPALFRTATSGRSIHTQVAGLPRLVELEAGAPHRPIRRYGYRSFDRQWAFDDPRLAKTESPSLWASQSNRQIYLATMITKPLGAGPALTCSAHVPDLDYFCGRGGKDVIPLFRDAACEHPNVTHGLLARLGELLDIETPTPEQLAAYVYALLSSVDYQRRFADALVNPGPRVPMTAVAAHWHTGVALGQRLLWLHSFAERLVDPARDRPPELPSVDGLRWLSPVTQLPARPSAIRYDAASQRLHVGDGCIVGVTPAVWSFEVSRMPVVKKWLGYRTARGAGRAAGSDNLLDQLRPTRWEWDQELLELLAVLTVTLDMQADLSALLERVCTSPRISAADLPQPGADERREPKVARPDADPDGC